MMLPIFSFVRCTSSNEKISQHVLTYEALSQRQTLSALTGRSHVLTDCNVCIRVGLKGFLLTSSQFAIKPSG